MTEQSNTQTQQKKESPEPQRAPGPEETAAPGMGMAAPALAAASDSPEGHARILRDPRIRAIQRQQLAAWLGRTRGNRFLQRLIDPPCRAEVTAGRPTADVQRGGGSAGGGVGSTPATGGAAGTGTATAGAGSPGLSAGGGCTSTVEAGTAVGPPTLAQQIDGAITATGSDEAAISTALRGASAAERQALLGNTTLMAKMRANIGRAALSTVARILATGMATADRVRVAAALFDLSAAPVGKIRDATGLLLLSEQQVDRNTAQRILTGDMAVKYMEDLTQPPNVAALVTGYGYDPALYTVYYKPGTTEPMLVLLIAEGLQIPGTNIICGKRSLALERWQSLLVHETSHARNPSPNTPLQYYQTEFRAYWVAEYRGVADLDERARQVKAHVLRDYPHIRAAYDADTTVRNAIDAYTRPTGNITNV